MRDILRSPGYRKVLVVSAVIGVPVSLIAFWFPVGLHELEHILWTDLPEALGRDGPPWRWPLPLLMVSGVVIGLVASRLPGAGGHVWRVRAGYNSSRSCCPPSSPAEWDPWSSPASGGGKDGTAAQAAQAEGAERAIRP
ncbi:hypothetical protein ACIQV3_09505 [Streptomyces sp. NPDC099050]|uniref:hypothetical protein n=1 Tax=Streptomyces sp. NPDC099050 TaxID=3366100 RepID=UPI0037F49BFD